MSTLHRGAPGGPERGSGSRAIIDRVALTHRRLGTWDAPEWRELLAPTLADEPARLAYN